jgi:hypothetical protein
MRIAILLIWLMLPIVAAAYHYGPGQERLVLDDVSTMTAQAEQAAQAEQWAKAEELYGEALKNLPGDGYTHQRRRLRLEQAKAQMNNHKLPSAHDDLSVLVEEMQDDKDADPTLLAEARSAMANSQYYLTWLMRLEGRPREDWEPEIESARQTYKLLAEQSEKSNETKQAKKNREDLESAIRLARMDLKDLQGLPLPSQ